MDDVDRILDTALLLQVQAGVASAFEELIARHHGGLRYFARRLVADSAAADDVVQETWLAAVRQAKLIRSGAAFRVWLYRVAHNRAMSHLRGSRTRSVVSVDKVEDLPEADAETLDDESIRAEEAADVHRALGRLSLEHREILTLRFMEEMTYDEMAAVLGCSVGTIRSRLFYGKKQLLRIMQESPLVSYGDSR
ncbi:MAG TPA: RNA polymerase sigma factor [Gemmataceae bacterium]|jgi:RNA polymerase sigma-70 factor (ECF subfamily)|nr:RNA polymerase sigma factor [Gemmataceae bacterium]